MADRPLHIGVDGRELLAEPTGVGRYLDRVLDEWLRDASFPHRVTIFVPRAPDRSAATNDSRIRWEILPAAQAGTWWEQTTLARALRTSGVDVVFAAGYTAPLRLNRPLVVAVYDVSFFAHPEWFSAREGWRRRWLTRSAARRARSVITISEFSAAEIVRWLGVPRTRLRLAPPGAPPLAPGRDVRSRAPVVLFVGSLFTRRRIGELIQAFALVAPEVPNARLVLVGPNRTMPPLDPQALAANFGIADRMEWRPYVRDQELAELYANARVFAFLSDYEGFGMTPLEAMAHGVPPVLLDTPISREVTGDAARLVGPDPSAIADALRSLLTDDESAARLVAAGRRCLARYSWAATANVVRRALEEAVDGR